jgi:uncharacterized membrane protein
LPTWAANWLEWLRTRFWFLPALMCAGAFGLGFLLPWIDGRFVQMQDIDGEPLFGLIFDGNASGARVLLGTVAGSAIGVAGTVFSITVGALTLASSQLGPRLLRQFIADRGNQFTLGVFLGTFVFCLTVLPDVRGGDADVLFVPHVSVTVALALAMLSLAVLIYFLQHLASGFQPSHVINDVGTELDGLIDTLDNVACGIDDGAQNGDKSLDAIEGFEGGGSEVAQVWAVRSGYIESIDYRGLFAEAVGHDGTVFMLHRPGSYVAEGSALMLVKPPSFAEAGTLRPHVQIGPSRTLAQDLEFARDQLLELALRALSPGINDPFTAMNALDRLGAAIARMGRIVIPGPRRRDEDGVVRVVVQQVDYTSFVHGCFAPIRQAARGSFNVQLRLLEVILTCGLAARDDAQRTALWNEAELTIEEAREQAKGLDADAVDSREAKLRQVLLDGKRDGPNLLTGYRE